MIALRSDPKQIDPREVVSALVIDWDTVLWGELELELELLLEVVGLETADGLSKQ
jgi:hypothetical protein